MQPDSLDNYAELLRREAQDSDYLLAKPSEVPLALRMEWEAKHHEADRQRYEADLESAERVARDATAPSGT